MLGLGLGNNKVINSLFGISYIQIPQSISLSEATPGTVVVSWTDVSQNVDGYKVYRRLSTDTIWTLIDTVGEGVEVVSDSTVASNTEYDFKVVAYIGALETIEENEGENFYFITTYEILTGLLFDGNNKDYLLRTGSQTLTLPWSIKFGLQDAAPFSTAAGIFGSNSSTTFRTLIYTGSNQIRMNQSTLLTSPTLNPLDIVSRGIREIYADSGGDIYYKATPTSTPEYLFNMNDGTPTLSLNTLMRCGGGGSDFYTNGYLYYFEVTNGGTTETFDLDEGSGNTITGSLGTVWTITTLQDINYINNTMWIDILPAPSGFIEFVSLSVSGRTTQDVDINLSTPYTSYSSGTTERRIAEIIDNGNPEGFSHALLTTITNDVANVASFLTPDEYETHLTSVVQQLKLAGVTPIICFGGTLVTSVKQSQKDYDDTIGAMLSGDPLNPTPESGWDFNVASVGVEAVFPLYVAKAEDVATAESVTFINTFQAFIDGQVAPYDQWVGADGTHFNPTGYTSYGQTVADGMVGEVGVTKVVVLGDSLGNTETSYIQLYYNS